MELMFNTNPTNSAGKYFLTAVGVSVLSLPALVGSVILFHKVAAIIA